MKKGRVVDVKKIWLSSAETKKYLDCSDNFLQQLRDNAEISFTRVGGKYYHNVNSIERLMTRNKIV